MKRRSPRIWSTMVVVAASLVATTAGALNIRDASTVRPTLAQLEASIAASVLIKATPSLSTTVPRLISITSADESISPIRWACYPKSNNDNVTLPTDALTRCAYGNTAVSRVILLTGDSQAGMWLPTFDQLGRDFNWKIVFLAHPECPPWGVPNKPSWIIHSPFTVQDCTNYQTNIVRWVAANQPAVVVLAGRAHPKGSDVNAPLVLSELQPLVSAEIHALQHPSNVVITLSPLPSYAPNWTAYNPGTCLAYIKPITNCEGSPVQMVSQVLLQAEINAAKTNNSVELSITPLFCTSVRCSLFIKDGAINRLVYADGHHMNSHYSVWISAAFESLIKSKIPS